MTSTSGYPGIPMARSDTFTGATPGPAGLRVRAAARYPARMPEFETLLYEVVDGVAWVTLNRPELHNAFNRRMQAELKGLWRGLRHDDDVRCVVLTGAGDRAFSRASIGPRRWATGSTSRRVRERPLLVGDC